MDLIGFLDDLIEYANNIYDGRKGLKTDGGEREGRINYQKGIAGVLDSFKLAQQTKDPLTIILSELAFLKQDLQFCHESEKATINSLKQAIQSFDDALRCLPLVDNPIAYKAVEAAFPTSKKYRVSQGFPKDAVHLACISHRTRLQNNQTTPGVDLVEKDARSLSGFAQFINNVLPFCFLLQLINQRETGICVV